MYLPFSCWLSYFLFHQFVHVSTCKTFKCVFSTLRFYFIQWLLFFIFELNQLNQNKINENKIICWAKGDSERFLINTVYIPKQWIVFFMHFDWLLELGIIVCAIHLPACESCKQSGFLVSYRNRKRNTVYKEAVPSNTKKPTKFSLAIFTSTVLFLPMKLSAQFVCNNTIYNNFNKAA